jgi:hypothetical protein
MTNDKAQIPNKAQNPNDKKKYDLEERTAQLGEAIIELVRTFSQDSVNSPLISQIVRAATSVGANYMEKEAKETKHWLRMIAKANPSRRDECQKLLKEAQELSLIFSSILLSKKE